MTVVETPCPIGMFAIDVPDQWSGRGSRPLLSPGSPMPEVEPVTNAVLPESGRFCICFLSKRGVSVSGLPGL